MQGIGGDAALASSLIRDMAMQLQVPSASTSQNALGLLDEIDQQLQDVMQQLPKSFLAPMLAADSLNEQQVRSCGSAFAHI